MSTPIRLFVEGGGDRNHALQTACRQAFSALLEKAGLKGTMPRIVACGGRQNAFDRFRSALERDSQHYLSILLVDSEAAVTSDDPWRHVAERRGDGWKKPDGATADQLHLMVQCMEAWLLVDRKALQNYFGKSLKEGKLPAANRQVEGIAKGEPFTLLQQATAGARGDGAYQKGSLAFKILGEVDPNRLRRASSWADRFFATLERLTKAE